MITGRDERWKQSNETWQYHQLGQRANAIFLDSVNHRSSLFQYSSLHHQSSSSNYMFPVCRCKDHYKVHRTKTSSIHVNKLTHSVYYSSNEPLRHCLCPCLPIMYWWERICSFLIRAGVLKQMTISWGYRQYLHNVLCVCVCTTIIECIWHHCCNSSTYM